MNQTVTLSIILRFCPRPIRSDAIKVFSISGGIPPHNDQGDTPQDQVKKRVVLGPEGGPPESTGQRQWVGRAWQNHNLTHLLTPKGGLSPDGFYSGRTGVKEDCGWAPGLTGPKKRGGLTCPLSVPNPPQSHPALPAALHYHLS